MAKYFAVQLHLAIFLALTVICKSRPSFDSDKFVVETLTIDLIDTQNALESFMERISQKIKYIDEADSDAHIVTPLVSVSVEISYYSTVKWKVQKIQENNELEVDVLDIIQMHFL